MSYCYIACSWCGCPVMSGAFHCSPECKAAATKKYKDNPLLTNVTPIGERDQAIRIRELTAEVARLTAEVTRLTEKGK